MKFIGMIGKIQKDFISMIQKLKKPSGALVASVSEKSPADKAGLKAGDIILKFDGTKITTMRKLPKVVANTEVGKKVELEIWRDKKLIKKRLTLGRLESSADFKAADEPKEFSIESLKILVRGLTQTDIKQRELPANTKGALVIDLKDKSPLQGFVDVNEIILEVQKKPITPSTLNKSVERIVKSGEKTLLLTIINNNNRRRYIGVKIN